MEIPESMRSDAGNYRCIAENPFGTARTVGEVQVLKEARKPFEERLKDQLKVKNNNKFFKINLKNIF